MRYRVSNRETGLVLYPISKARPQISSIAIAAIRNSFGAGMLASAITPAVALNFMIFANP